MAVAQIQVRRGTTAEWAAASPVVLAAGEPGYDTTLNRFRIGDGSTEWAALGDVDTSKHKIVACALRNTGSGWEMIDDSQHTPINVESVTDSSSAVTINYSFTASKVGTLVVTPDETFCKMGLFCGASVGLALSAISMHITKPIGGYVYYDTSWHVPTGFTFGSFTGGVLTLSHEACGSNPYASLTARGGACLAFLGAAGNTTTQMVFTTLAGATITSANSTIKAYLMRTVDYDVDPTALVSAAGNLWVYGIMEV